MTDLRAALDNLVCALGDPDIATREQIKIELDYEAGKRFERWFAINCPPLVRMAQDWSRTAEGDKPVRWVVLDGIEIRWPVKLMMLPDRTVIAEPPAQVVRLALAGED